jgi:hypothetical protein
MTLPPPKPSIQMASYNNPSGGCFASWCRIKLINGTYKRLDELIGDEILFVNGSDSNYLSTGGKIKYIVKTKIDNEQIEMCRINNLYITSWHPINIYSDNDNDNIWKFPCYITIPFIQNIDYVYNIVLEQNQEYNIYSVIIEDTECITMGHCINDFNYKNDILEHPYFGTESIITDIKRFSKNNNKIVTIQNYKVSRDNNTRVCSITPL